MTQHMSSEFKSVLGPCGGQEGVPLQKAYEMVGWKRKLNYRFSHSKTAMELCPMGVVNDPNHHLRSKTQCTAVVQAASWVIQMSEIQKVIIAARTAAVQCVFERR